jgi:hypothetical protein
MTPVVEALEALGVAYQVGGSVASSALGVARATLDVDLVADLRAEHVARLCAALDATYYVSEEAVRDAVGRRSSFNVIHLDTMVKVDVFVLKQRPYDQRAFGRRVADTLDEGAGARLFFLATAEDVILNKLEWYRLGGGVSGSHWDDVLGVLSVQAGRLDLAYLAEWAAQLGVGDLLERARVEVAG